MWTLLVIDDSPKQARVVARWFRPPEYEVICVHSATEGLEKARELQPDLILLDMVMPEMSGQEVLLRLRRDLGTSRIPVIIRSIRANYDEELQSLMLTTLRGGANYVVAEKWSMASLEQVVRSLLAPEEQPRVITARGHTLALAEDCVEVAVDGEQIRLTRLEAAVLHYLDSHRGQPRTVMDIEAAVWKDQGGGDERRVRRVIHRLREKIEPDRKKPCFVEAVRGFGYRLTASDSP